MVRGAIMLLILANMGSILGQLSSQEMIDKAQMLKYLRGGESDSTTVRTNILADGFWETAKPKEPIWELRSTRKPDKSKMLDYLRGVETSSSILTDDLSNSQDEFLSTESWNLRNIQNLARADEFEETFESGAVPYVPILLPAEKESGTSIWQQPKDRTGQDDENKRALSGCGGKEPCDPSQTDTVGPQISKTWTCLKKKFYISTQKIKKLVCDMFDSLYGNNVPTTTKPTVL